MNADDNSLEIYAAAAEALKKVQAQLAKTDFVWHGLPDIKIVRYDGKPTLKCQLTVYHPLKLQRDEPPSGITPKYEEASSSDASPSSSDLNSILETSETNSV